MKIIIVIFNLLHFSLLFSQTLDTRLLKYHYLDWGTCNIDSEFYKRDTLYFNYNDTCERGVYFIINKNKLEEIREIEFGKTPAEPAKPLYKIESGKLVKKGSDYFIVFYSSGKLWKKFKIIELKEEAPPGDSMSSGIYKMILVKQ